MNPKSDSMYLVSFKYDYEKGTKMELCEEERVRFLINHEHVNIEDLVILGLDSRDKICFKKIDVSKWI